MTEKQPLNVLFSVDDVHPELGYGLLKNNDQFRYLKKLHDEFGIKFNLFVVPLWKNNPTYDIRKFKQWVDWIQEQGFYEISAHGITHQAIKPELGGMELVQIPEQEVFNKLAESKQIFEQVGIEVNGWKCYDDKTEVLTQNGWKFFKDLTFTDSIATANIKTQKLEYQTPTAIYEYDYEGDMVKFGGGRSISLLVTPNHKMVVENRKKKGMWILLDATKVNSNYNIVRNINWDGQEKEYYHIKNENGKTKIKMDDWLYFLGLYISEGSLDKNRITIYQHKDIDNIAERLSRLGVSVSKQKTSVRFSSGIIAEYLRQFNLLKSPTKYIPNEYKMLNKKQINILLDSLIYGDGSIRENGGRRYYTTSKLLADDIQELIFKTGKSSNILFRKTKGNQVKLPNKPIYYQNHDMYVVCEYKTLKSASVRPYSKKTVKYKGKVYCVTIPNNTLIVRRENKPVISGNSPGWIHPNTIYKYLYQLGYKWIADHYLGEEPIKLTNGLIQIPYNCNTEELWFAHPRRTAILHSHINPAEGNKNGWTDKLYNDVRNYLLELQKTREFKCYTMSEWIENNTKIQ